MQWEKQLGKKSRENNNNKKSAEGGNRRERKLKKEIKKLKQDVARVRNKITEGNKGEKQLRKRRKF